MEGAFLGGKGTPGRRAACAETPGQEGAWCLRGMERGQGADRVEWLGPWPHLENRMPGLFVWTQAEP